MYQELFYEGNPGSKELTAAMKETVQQKVQHFDTHLVF
jgi:hypothetical protein